MTRRYQIHTDTHFVEFDRTVQGLHAARVFKRQTPAFSRKHIRDVIQSEPSKVQVGIVYAFDIPPEKQHAVPLDSRPVQG